MAEAGIDISRIKAHRSIVLYCCSGGVTTNTADTAKWSSENNFQKKT